jgi:hypothetical protein
VVNAVNAQNLILPGGTAKIGTLEYNVNLNGSTATVEALNDLPVSTSGGRVIYLHDVAHVRDGYAPQTNIVRADGTRSALLQIDKSGDASTLAISSYFFSRTLIPTLAMYLLWGAAPGSTETQQPVGPFLRFQHRFELGFLKLRSALTADFPGVTFGFLPADIISQILNFGLPSPIDIQIVGGDVNGNRTVATQLLARLRRLRSWPSRRPSTSSIWRCTAIRAVRWGTWKW